MKEKEWGFFVKAKRFLWPIKENKLSFLAWWFLSILWWINAIIHILFLERLTYYLDKWLKEGFTEVLQYYMWYIILFEIVWFWSRKIWWVEIFGKTWISVSDVYLNKFLNLDNNIVETHGTWKLISIVHWAIKTWGFLIWDVLETGIITIISILFAFYMVIKIELFYWFVFLLLIIIFSILSIYFNSKLKPYRITRNDNTNLISAHFTKILMNKTEILQTSNLERELNILNKYYKKDISLNQQMWTFRFLMKDSAQFWINIMFMIGYFYLWNLYFSEEIELNILVWFWGALIFMQRAISNAIWFYIQFNRDFIAITKLWDFFDSTPIMQWYDTGEDFMYMNWNIAIKNISYSYSEWKHIIKDFSLDIKWWKILALVWSSWWGKSTIAKLIAGYIHTNIWDIIIDNQKLRDINLKSYYKNIGYLTQEPSVFDGTIYDNLTYALEYNPLKDDLDKIIKLSKCEFIYDLENWINTEIWERGIRLSWGQRQRLAIAKIFLKDPKIIILDEPTSALDSFSEEQITKAMHNLFENRTVIIIAHRLQTVKHADKIIVLENWKIIEEGKHDALVEKWGQYAKMLELQSGF